MNKLNIIMQKFSFSNRTLLGKFCGIFALTLCIEIFFHSFPNPLNRPELFYIIFSWLGFLVFTIGKK